MKPADYVSAGFLFLEEVLYNYRNDSKRFVRKVREYIEENFRPNENQLITFVQTERFNQIFGEINCLEPCSSLKVTNIDMIFSNIKLDDSGQVFVFDLEWVFDFPIPYRYCIWRAANEVYEKYCAYLKRSISKLAYFGKLGFENAELELFEMRECSFREHVFGVGMKEVYTKNMLKM